MKKNDLLQFIKGDVSEKEKNRVLDWIDNDENNKSYFIQLRNQWILSTLPQERVSDDAYKEIGDLIKQKSHHKSFKIWMASVAAVLVLFLVLSPFLADSYNNFKFRNWVTVVNNKESAIFLCLPDGSKVGLNSNAQISYAKQFKKNKREVKINGEVYFEVVSNPLCPMVVTTPDKINVKVIGTTFMVNTEDNTGSFNAILIEGSIELSIPSIGKRPKNKLIMKSGDRVVVSKNMDYVRSRIENTEEELLWVNSWFDFDNTNMSIVIERLQSYYNVKFQVKDSTINDLLFTATIKGETLEQVLEMLYFSMNLNYRRKENIVELSY